MEQSVFWYRKATIQDHDLAIEKCKELGVTINTPIVDREAICKDWNDILKVSRQIPSKEIK